MKTLQDIQDEVAKESTQIDWNYALANNGTYGISILWHEVCIRYAKELSSQQINEYKQKLTKKLNNLPKDTHGRIFTTEVISLIDSIQ